MKYSFFYPDHSIIKSLIPNSKSLFYFNLLTFVFETGNQYMTSSIGCYEYLIMSQQWPPTVCKTLPCAREKIRETFGIHGLWPENTTEFCSNDRYHKMPKALEDELHIEWPNLKEGEEDEDFWKREWNKHGTYSRDKFNQTEYFELALRIKKKVDLLELLKQGGIMPSDDQRYSLMDIVNAVKDGINNSEPGILCYYKNNETSNLLKEIRVCLEADGRFYKDCPQSIREVNCKKNMTNITLPI